jgi:CDP-diacylglycerol--glycerol-3-phosphate 3-phosphatidyltransferase
MKSTGPFWNVPNALSLYRLFVFPLIIGTVFTESEGLFIVLITISLLTDFLDGMIARLFHMETEIGARLDSVADIGTFIAAFLGIIIFKWDIIQEHFWILVVFFSLNIFADVFSLIKFHGLASLHIYSFKITGYIQGSFFIVFFLWKFIESYYYLAMIWGILACIEEIIILAYLKERKSNVKGLYWILKEKK